MCDERSFADMDAHAAGTGGLTRREFGVLSVGAGLAMMWPGEAIAAELSGTEVTIETPDGRADAFFVHPKTGRHPGVLLWPDAFGLRPTMRQMASRLAAEGYAVLAVNPYYRTAPAPVLPEGADFADPPTRERIMSLMGSITSETQARDARAFVDFLDAQPAVAPDRKIGTMGYCMGAFHDADGGGATRSRGRRGVLPRRPPRHEGRGQPASADPEDEGALPDRDRRER